MVNKPAKLVVLVGVVVIVLSAWHVAMAGAGKTAKAEQDPKAAKADKPNKAKAVKSALPTAAAEAVKKAFPQATVAKVAKKRKSVLMYEVELADGENDAELEITPSGQIASVERELPKSDLPAPVAKALAKLAGDAQISEIEKKELHAVIRMVKLAKPKVFYGAEFVKNGKEVEVRISPDGKVLARQVEDREDDDNNGQHDDDDD